MCLDNRLAMRELTQIDPKDYGISLSKEKLLVVQGGAVDFYQMGMTRPIKNPIVISIHAPLGQVLVKPDTIILTAENSKKRHNVLLSLDNSNHIHHSKATIELLHYVSSLDPEYDGLMFRLSVFVVFQNGSMVHTCGNNEKNQLGLLYDIPKNTNDSEQSSNETKLGASLKLKPVQSYKSKEKDLPTRYDYQSRKHIFNPLPLEGSLHSQVVDAAGGDGFSLFLFESGNVYSAGEGACGQLGRKLKSDEILIKVSEEVHDDKGGTDETEHRNKEKKTQREKKKTKDSFEFNKREEQMKRIFAPLELSGSVFISQIACGTNHFLLLTLQGRVLSCGRGEAGQLGLSMDTLQRIATFSPSLEMINRLLKKKTATPLSPLSPHFPFSYNSSSPSSNFSPASPLSPISPSASLCPSSLNFMQQICPELKVWISVPTQIDSIDYAQSISCGKDSSCCIGVLQSDVVSSGETANRHILTWGNVIQSGCSERKTHPPYASEQEKQDTKVENKARGKKKQPKEYDETALDASEVPISKRLEQSVKKGEYPIKVSCGSHHYLVLTNLGGVYSWGDGYLGRLGLGSEKSTLIPRKVKINPCRDLCANGRHSAAIDEDFALWTWGDNSSGQLGIPSTTKFVTKPTKISFFNRKFITSLSLGEDHTHVSTLHGLAYSWGGNHSSIIDEYEKEKERNSKSLKTFKSLDVDQIEGEEKGSDDMPEEKREDGKKVPEKEREKRRKGKFFPQQSKKLQDDVFPLPLSDDALLMMEKEIERLNLLIPLSSSVSSPLKEKDVGEEGKSHSTRTPARETQEQQRIALNHYFRYLPTLISSLLPFKIVRVCATYGGVFILSNLQIDSKTKKFSSWKSKILMEERDDSIRFIREYFQHEDEVKRKVRYTNSPLQKQRPLINCIELFYDEETIKKKTENLSQIALAPEKAEEKGPSTQKSLPSLEQLASTHIDIAKEVFKEVFYSPKGYKLPPLTKQHSKIPAREANDDKKCLEEVEYTKVFTCFSIDDPTPCTSITTPSIERFSHIMQFGIEEYQMQEGAKLYASPYYEESTARVMPVKKVSFAQAYAAQREMTRLDDSSFRAHASVDTYKEFYHEDLRVDLPRIPVTIFEFE